ncbi:hypothetical protein PIB30_031221 [Stylosanthes scabra]|uniref:Retrotransposon gag domain-containing protein n=1 Tax=Stylosanthes scabra TaxID=79078 RepID=A0ABU6TDM3_9FABA|nr:hypothetical protein [Stylosanthes scabra]
MVLSLNSLPIFDGRGNGYWWLIYVCKFWNSRKITEKEWLKLVYNALRGEAWFWYCSWRRINSAATWSQFELAFLHRYQSNYSSILPDPNQAAEDHEATYFTNSNQNEKKSEMADPDLDATNIHISAIQNSQVQIGKSTNSAPITQAKSEFHFIDNISTITTAQVISLQSILNSKTPPDSDSKTEGTTLPVFNLNLETNEDAEITAEEECINLGGKETALNNGTEDY